MATPADAAPFATYPTVSEYNAAFPDALMPVTTVARNVLRSFTCAGAGLRDDVDDSGVSYTLDFLPSGAPEPGKPDQVGTVVASRWGNAPYLVLAEGISLRAAWEAMTGLWPAGLSAAADVLSALSVVSDVND